VNYGQLLDQQGRGGGQHTNLGGSVLDLELDHLPNALHLGALLDDVLADLLGVQSERSQFGGQRGGGSAFAAEDFDADVFDFGGVGLGWH